MKKHHRMKFSEPEYASFTFPVYEYLIYFLCQGDVVVYVGQTKAGLYRPFSHKDKKYDNVKVIPCKLNELNTLEQQFIEKYKPRYNIVGLNGSPKLKAI